MKFLPFALTAKAKAFLSEYKLWDDVEKCTAGSAATLENEFDIEDDEERKNVYTLKAEIAQQLAKTYKIFTDGGSIDEYHEAAKNTVVAFIKETILSDADLMASFLKKTGKTDTDSALASLTIEAEVNEDRLGGVSVDAKIALDEHEVDVEGLIYYSNSDSGAEIGEGAQSWNWLAWLGLEESPYHSSDFADAYLDDKKAQALSELSSYLGEGDGGEKILAAFLDLIAEITDYRIKELRNVGNTNGRDIKCKNCKEPYENLYVVDDMLGYELTVEDLILGPQQDDPGGPPTRIIGLKNCPSCK